MSGFAAKAFMTLEIAAEKFKSWAHDQGILSYDPPEELEAPEALDELTDAADATAAQRVLNRRRINFVGVNPDTNKVVVATHQKLTNKDREALPESAEGGFGLEFLHAAPPVVKSATAGPYSGGPAGLDGGRYCCGSSVFVGNRRGAGTMGALVRNANGTLFGLTNNHVTGACGYTEEEMPVLAPGPMDVRLNTPDPFTIGYHAFLHPLASGTPANYDVSGNIDAALFSIRDEALVSSMQREFFDTPPNVVAPRGGMLVEKVGRTTGRTTGTVVAKSVGYERVQIDLPDHEVRGVYYFKNVWAIQSGASQPFAAPGDSGSLVVCREPGEPPVAIGLLFACSKQFTFICPLQEILDFFKVSIVSGWTEAAMNAPKAQDDPGTSSPETDGNVKAVTGSS